MGKISPESIKYIVHAQLKLSGRAEKPDVIGAIFGQTEGLLGADLELRELQKNGRIGRIDVNLRLDNGKSRGEILLPSSLDKSETALVAASLETIEKIGPCTSEIEVTKIEDVRVSKRNYIVARAKDLLKKFVETMPDAAALTKDVAQTVRAMDIFEYGTDKLPACKGIEDADEIIIVEGRADVLNLVKYGMHNVIGLNGSKAPRSIIKLANSKEATVFVDGDRGGDLILKNLKEMADIDFIAKAPDGKEVEELTLKEINKALRSKEAVEKGKKVVRSTTRSTTRSNTRSTTKTTTRRPRSNNELSDSEKSDIKKIADELVGTKGAYLLDNGLEILGKVPVSELASTLKDMDKVYTVVMDGSADRALIDVAERKKVKHLIAKNVRVRSEKVDLLSASSL